MFAKLVVTYKEQALLEFQVPKGNDRFLWYTLQDCIACKREENVEALSIESLTLEGFLGTWI